MSYMNKEEERELEDACPFLYSVKCEENPQFEGMMNSTYRKALYDKNLHFMSLLESTPSLRRAFIDGLKTDGAPEDVDEEANKIIETGLKSRLEFAEEQLMCAVLCFEFFPSLAEKQRVVFASVYELKEALYLLDKWGTTDCIELFDDKLDLLSDGNIWLDTLGLNEDGSPKERITKGTCGKYYGQDAEQCSREAFEA